jgi:endonuclease VIII
MPEGDSIFRHAATLAPRFAGRAVTALHARGVAFPALVGQPIGAIEARGKHLLIPIGDRAIVHVHLGMNGRLRLIPAAEWSTTVAARASLALRTADMAALWSRARAVEVLRAAFAHSHPALRALGPSLLDETFDVAGVLARARARPAETSLGELLLDQRVAAGIGNVYKCEALFLEKLDPWAAIAGVDDDALARLYQTARKLMRRNLGPGMRVTTANGPRRYHVYRRTNDLCPACGARIASGQQGDPARTTYFCPKCQAPRAPAR